MKKTLSILLAALLVLFSFGGAFAEVELPIVEEPVTLKVCVASSGYCLVPWSEKEFYKNLSAETNVYFDWNELDDWTTQTNLLVASGDTPDLFFGSISSTTLAENLDMFYELTDMINEYAPSLVNVFEQEPSVLAAAKASDGGIYVLPNQFTFNLDNAIGTMFWINQDWLTAVDKENPTTIEEFEDVLVAFRDLDPNGNGQKDEIPLSLQETGWAGKFSDMFGIFGVLYDTSNYVDCDTEGTVYFQAEQPEFYEALVWLNHLAKEGLLDQESFSQTGDQFTTKISQNILGVCAKYNPLNFLDGYVPMNPIVGPNEVTLIEGTKDSTVNNNLLIPLTCECPEVVVKVYEYVNSDFSRRMSNRYGVQGVYWDFTGEGDDYVLHDYDGTPPEGYEFWDQYVYTVGETGSAGFALFSRDHLSHNVSPKTARETGILAYQPYFPEVEYHAGPLTEAENSERSLLFTEIDAYVRTFVSDAIFGEINEDIWNAHLGNLQKLQVERYVELCQTAYNNYVALLG
jgi:putative aldouronate transport system substrate-binding protein